MSQERLGRFKVDSSMPKEVREGLEKYKTMENGFYYRQGYYRCWNIVDKLDSVKSIDSIDEPVWRRVGIALAYVLKKGKNKVG